LPAGAVRVAPIETSVKGKIAFPDARWNGQMVSGLVLTFNKGKIVEISALSGEESVKTEISHFVQAGSVDADPLGWRSRKLYASTGII